MTTRTLQEARKLETDYNGTGHNNYGSWELVTKLHFEYLGLWEVIEGAKSQPPEIPTLKRARSVTGTGPDRSTTTVTIASNETEIDAARELAKPWLDKNKKVLRWIITLILQEKTHLLRDVSYARDAWRIIREEFRPANEITSVNLHARCGAHHFVHL
jgi:hypothetical protein